MIELYEKCVLGGALKNQMLWCVVY